MEGNKQRQTAGDNSTQIQAGIVQNFYTSITGIDESRAREICREEYAITRQEWSSEAAEIADKRVRIFEDKLMPKMIQYDQSLKVFADPSFQFALRKAQIAAASSERSEDYELLSELLVNRIEQAADRSRRLGIVKAIEVVDQIDEVALIGLSMVYAISKFLPTSRRLHAGLETLNCLYGKILSGKQLPEGALWMEHLDLLSAIRISEPGLHHFKKLEEYIPERFKIYLEAGIKEDSEEFNQLKNAFSRVSLSTSCFIDHPLKPGYLFLNVPRDIQKISIERVVNGTIVHVPLNDDQRTVIQEALSISCTDGSQDRILLDSFWREWKKYEHLRTVYAWWNRIPGSFEFTPVGVALSNAFIHGKDPTVPCLY